MNNSNHAPIFIKSIVSLLAVIIFSFSFFLRGTKDKTEFVKLTGQVVYYEKQYRDLPNRHFGKYRYLQLHNYNNTFEVFIGNETGDFKPSFEQLDLVQAGDTIDVYFDDNADEKNEPVNRLIQYVDRGGVPLYIKGSKDIYLGMGLIIFCSLMIGVLVILKRKGTIT